MSFILVSVSKLTDTLWYLLIFVGAVTAAEADDIIVLTFTNHTNNKNKNKNKNTFIISSPKGEDYYRNFKNSMKSIQTFYSYNYKLINYMQFKGYTDYAQLIISDNSNSNNLQQPIDAKIVESDIIGFLVSLRERHYSYGSRQCYLNAICHFYDINDVPIRRKKISRFLGSNDDESVATADDNDITGGLVEYREDKPYSHEQIARLLEFSDERTKIMILLMSSAGLRLGALPGLKVGNLIPVDTHSLYQITAYATARKSRYYTFCTPECRAVIDNYLDFRRRCGERITVS